MPIAHFSKIVIIQSLPHGDEFTGTKLHEDLEILAAFYELGLEIDLVNVTTKRELLDTLESLKICSVEDGSYPLLHLEIHGRNDASGLVLSSGEYVSWDDLKAPLTEINVASRLNLFIVLAVCHGAHLTKIIRPVDRAPCLGLVGPTKEVSTGMVLTEFYEFYKTLLKTGSGGKAFRALAGTSEKEEFENIYYLSSAEQLFKAMYARYIAEECSPNSIDRRAKKIYRELKKKSGNKVASVGQIKRNLKQNQECHFSKLLSNFFMFDLYEENRSRFNIEYKDVSERRL